MCRNDVALVFFTLFTLGVASGSLLQNSGADLVLDVEVNLDHILARTYDKYIGFTIDTNYILKGNLSRLDISSPKLLAVMQPFRDSYLRVGGTDADVLLFDPTVPGQRNNTVGPGILQKLFSLLKLADWNAIFDFNVMVRTVNGDWDPVNTRLLLTFFQQQAFPIAYFQLGNEPNVFPEKYNQTVSGRTLAQDYLRFKAVLGDFLLYRYSGILGPEVTRLTGNATRDYLVQFLEADGGQALSALGVHHYICPGNPPVDLSFFTNATVMENLRDELDILTAIARQYVPKLPLWFSETGTTFTGCPGDPILKRTYAGGFLWQDKLSLSAQYGVEHLNRQEFFQNMVDSNLDPVPSYYQTLLFRRLVRGPVFRVNTTTPTVRFYAHCTNPESSYRAGAITVIVISVETIDITLTFSQFKGQRLDLYLLTPGDAPGLLTSKTVALNGRQLVMDGNELPPLMPKSIQLSSFVMPARSYGFVVVPDANVTACKP